MKFANFPFAVVPCKLLVQQQQQSSSSSNATGGGASSSIMMASSVSMMNQNHNNNDSNDDMMNNNNSSENFFATLATKSIVSDLSDQPMSAAHHRADIWFNCGSVLVLRKDFQPVTCGQVVRLFELLTELWGFTVSNDEEDQKIAKKNRLDVFSNVTLCRKKLAEKMGKMIDHDGTMIELDAKTNELSMMSPSTSSAVLLQNDSTVKFTPSVEHSGLETINNENNELLAGTHVINTYSRKEELIRHHRGRDMQQVKMLKEQGNKLYKGRRFRTALLRYDEGLMLDPQNPELLYNRAAALLELAMFELALDSCDRALDAATILRPGDTGLSSKIKARRNLALRKLGKFDDVEMVKSPEKSGKMLTRKPNHDADCEEDDNNGEEEQDDIAE